MENQQVCPWDMCRGCVLSENVAAKMECVMCDQKNKILACLEIRCGLALWIAVTLVYWFNTTQTTRASRSVQSAHWLYTSHSERSSCRLRALFEAGCLTDVFAPKPLFPDPFFSVKKQPGMCLVPWVQLQLRTILKQLCYLSGWF